MRSIAIVDASPLYAWADRTDADHIACRDVLTRSDFHLIIPAMVITEVTYFLGRRLGARAEAAFVRGLREFEIEAPLADEWSRIAELVEQYADFPLGTTDASVIALAERFNTEVVITLDRRHFGAVRPLHVPSLRLLPPDDQPSR
jgi:predicted nucleic acid-binding protein